MSTRTARYDFYWRVVADRHNVTPAAVLLASYAMLHRSSRDRATVVISLSDAARKCRCPRRTMQRALARLVARRHLIPLDRTYHGVSGSPDAAGRYAFGPGP